MESRVIRQCRQSLVARLGIPVVVSRLALTALAMLTIAALLTTPPVGAQSGGTLPGLRGGSLAASDLANGTHVLIVWASWSPRCRDIVPRANDVVARFGDRARVATVNFQEEPAAIEEFLAGKSLSAPIYLDRSGDFSKAHAVTTLPGLIVYRDGEVLFQGRLDAEADQQIDRLLK